MGIFIMVLGQTIFLDECNLLSIVQFYYVTTLSYQ